MQCDVSLMNAMVTGWRELFTFYKNMFISIFPLTAALIYVYNAK